LKKFVFMWIRCTIEEAQKSQPIAMI